MTERNWGAFFVQKRGKVKWTTLRGGFYWGEGYNVTKEAAAKHAKLRLQLLQAHNKDAQYRIDPPIPPDL